MSMADLAAMTPIAAYPDPLDPPDRPHRGGAKPYRLGPFNRWGHLHEKLRNCRQKTHLVEKGARNSISALACLATYEADA
jgi:hypothetical protein